MHFSAHQFVKGVRLIAANAHPVSTVNGPGIDTRGFRELLATLSIDDVGVGPAIVDFKLQESSDDGASDPYTDIAGAAFAQKNAAGVFVGRLDLELRERYIRAVMTVAVNAADAAAIGSLLHSRDLPVTQENTAEFSVGT